jgi:hypothetical protein
MAVLKNTSYKVHVQHTDQTEVDAVNIENGAMLHTNDALYMGHSDENVIVYPQGGIKSLGWARYDDNEYTSSSKLSLTDQTEVTLTNNGNSTYRSHSSIDFYNTTTDKLVGLNENDVYMFTLVFKKSAANANQTHLDFRLTGADGYDRINKVLAFYKGNDVEQNCHEVFQYYIDANALANGLTPKIQSHGGTAKIWDIIFFIQRTQNASLS